MIKTVYIAMTSRDNDTFDLLATYHLAEARAALEADRAHLTARELPHARRWIEGYSVEVSEDTKAAEAWRYICLDGSTDDDKKVYSEVEDMIWRADDIEARTQPGEAAEA